MSELKAQITAAMKDAMRAKDKERLGTIRMILAEFQRVEVDERIQLDDPRALAILDKMAKQRRDAAQQFRDAGRDDLADQEEREIVVIQEYLPQPLTEAEINQLIEAAMADTGASSMQDMGKVMGVLKPQVQGRADMAAVSQLIKARLG